MKRKIKSDSGHESKQSFKKNSFVNSYFWQILSFILLVLLIISVVIMFTNNNKLDKPYDLKTANKIGEDTKVFLIDVFNLPDLVLEDSVYENGMYLHTFKVQDTPVKIYTSLDGEMIFIPGLDPINKNEINLEENNKEPEQNLEKSEKPVVELFIMSHCPYGTQIEKGILPVVDLLDDKIDFEIKFVNYIMHDLIEINEQILQYCIQKDSKEKFKEYLYCFLEDGDTNRCLTETEITMDSINECITKTDQDYNIMDLYQDKSTWNGGRYPQFLIHNEENILYNVSSSPTLVINGSIVSSGRDSQSLLNSICNAFESKPRACNEKLSNSSPKPGFGFESSTSSVSATCG